MGDPCGIGPEVTAKALSQPLVYERCRPIVLGSIAALEAAIEVSGNDVSANAVRSLDDAAGEPGGIDVLDPGNLDYGLLAPGELSAEAGRASVEWVLKAGELAASGAVRAIVTAPINKEACSLAGYKDVGHMENLPETERRRRRGDDADGRAAQGRASDHPSIVTGRVRLRGPARTF